MADPTLANQNSPTLGALAAAFWAALVGWGVDSVSLPANVEATGAALLIALGAVVAGRVVQRHHTLPRS